MKKKMKKKRKLKPTIVDYFNGRPDCTYTFTGVFQYNDFILGRYEDLSPSYPKPPIYHDGWLIYNESDIQEKFGLTPEKIKNHWLEMNWVNANAVILTGKPSLTSQETINQILKGLYKHSRYEMYRYTPSTSCQAREK